MRVLPHKKVHLRGIAPPQQTTEKHCSSDNADDEWHIYGTPDSKLNQFVELWPKLTEQAKQESLTFAKSYLD